MKVKLHSYLKLYILFRIFSWGRGGGGGGGRGKLCMHPDQPPVMVAL